MQKPKDEMRERILEAALDLFAERGYRASSMPEIARAAGTAVGNLYRYFPSKEALLDAALPDSAVSEIEGLTLSNLRVLAASGSSYRPGGRSRKAADGQASHLGRYRRELGFLFKGASGSKREGFSGRLAAMLAEAYRSWAESIGAAVPKKELPLIGSLYASMLELASEALLRSEGDLARVIEYHAAGMAALAESWRKK